ncbi:MAG: HAMP domain-containing histidine kinase, partial [Clostridia bacterium]|nr:HAMP domain-containing histidine kinase [Clostridia bacterium]
LIMAIFIARRLSRPINNITREAEKLAQGDYNNTVFDGTGYAETEELAATLNYASDELSKADKLQKDLIANVSHDLKTPLTMVKSYAEMIRDISGEKKEKRERHLQVIINEADRLNELVNDLVTLSKMQANVDALTLEDVNLEQAARETLDSFSLHTEQDGFTMELQAEGATDVSCDSKKIRQVFANLIGNAVRYSSDDKYIMVKLTERADSVLCEVVDHGQGIPPEDQESVWDRYYQSSSNHSRTSQGTGLGLSIVKQILIQHKAEFGVRSKLNEGSDFWFELPKDPLMKR